MNKLKRFGGTPSVGGKPGAREAWGLGPYKSSPGHGQDKTVLSCLYDGVYRIGDSHDFSPILFTPRTRQSWLVYVGGLNSALVN